MFIASFLITSALHRSAICPATSIYMPLLRSGKLAMTSGYKYILLLRSKDLRTTKETFRQSRLNSKLFLNSSVVVFMLLTTKNYVYTAAEVYRVGGVVWRHARLTIGLRARVEH